MLTRNHRQEAMSRAYVQAVAGRCGLSCSVREFDYGIDLTLHDIARRGARRYETGYKLDVQAKSTTLASLNERFVLYDLPVANYDDLRATDAGCPRILVVLVLPEDEAAWINQTEEGLLLRHAAYWMSLRGRPSSGNRRSVRVELPRANLFSVSALSELMAKVKKQELL